MGNKSLIKLFIGSEAIFFICLILAFIYLKNFTGFDQEGYKFLDIGTTGVFTFFLLSSSATFYMVERSYKARKFKVMGRWLLFTIFLGLVFLGGQAHEYFGLFEKQITMSRDVFGSSFFTLTGFHGLHVLIGLITLSILYVFIRLGDLENTRTPVVENIGMYWHFVDAVWVVVFFVVYVVPHLPWLHL